MTKGILTAVFWAILTPLAVNAAELGAPVIEGRDLRTEQAASVSVEGHSGLVVVFLSSRCPCSDSHIREVKELSAAYKSFRFVAIHANRDEPLDEARNYFKAKDLKIPVVQDENGRWLKYFKALKTPHAFVVLPDGKTAYQGGISDSKDLPRAEHRYLREALEDLTAKRPVRTAHARTLGCAIPRSL